MASNFFNFAQNTGGVFHNAQTRGADGRAPTFSFQGAMPGNFSFGPNGLGGGTGTYQNVPHHWQGWRGNQLYARPNQHPGGSQNPFMGLAQQQFDANRRAADANQANFQQAANLLRGVPGRFEADPVNQASRQNALDLANDPLTINDETKQMITNRGSNLINAAANSQQRRNMGNLALAGQLGGSTQMDSQQAIERDRFARLGDLASNVEIEARQRRGEDLERSARLGQDVAGKTAGLDLSTAQTLIQNLPQVNPDDYSMFLAVAEMLGLGQQGGAQPRDFITDSRGNSLQSIGRGR